MCVRRKTTYAGYAEEMDAGYAKEMDAGFNGEMDAGYAEEMNTGFNGELDAGYAVFSPRSEDFHLSCWQTLNEF